MDEQSIEEDLGELLDKHSEAAAKSVKDEAKSTLPKYRDQRSRFEERLQKRWQDPFELFEIILVLTREIGDEFNNTYREKASQENDLTFGVLVRLHARACLVASEVYQLLRGGFASGALSRWRSLHETAVVGFFVAEHGDDVAERYLAHEVVQSYWAAKEYTRHHSTLGYEALEAGTTDALKEKCDRLESKYGRSFFCSDYAWAHEAVNEGCTSEAKVTFELLEKEVGLDHLRPFYRMASHSVHANPKSMSFDIGVTGQRNIMLAGSSNTGFADPGACTCVSLHQATVALLNHFPSAETLLELKTLERLVDEAKVLFAQVQHQVEVDETSLQEKGRVK